jgi:hypothetical protein
VVWAKFLMLRFESYYGNEFYCPLSLVRVYGRTMMQDLRQPPSSSSPSSSVASATQSTANTADSAPVGATGGNAITTTSPPIATVCHPTAAADPKLIAVPPAVLTYSWTELVPTAVVFEDFMKLPPQLDPVIPLQSQESATTPTETTTIAPPAATTLLAPIEATQPASETIAIIDQITANNVTTATLDSNQTMTTTTTPQPPVQQPAHNEDGEQHVDDPTENVFKSIITRVSRLEDNWQLHNQRLQESLHQLETIYRQRFDKFFTAFNQSSYYHLEQLVSH